MTLVAPATPLAHYMCFKKLCVSTKSLLCAHFKVKQAIDYFYEHFVTLLAQTSHCQFFSNFPSVLEACPPNYCNGGRKLSWGTNLTGKVLCLPVFFGSELQKSSKVMFVLTVS